MNRKNPNSNLNRKTSNNRKNENFHALIKYDTATQSVEISRNISRSLHTSISHRDIITLCPGSFIIGDYYYIIIILLLL